MDIKEKCAVVIPIYKSDIVLEEQISLRQIKKTLSKYPIYFIAPLGLDFTEYQKLIPEAKVKYFEANYFCGFTGYNRLMTSKELYIAFEAYEKILICQTDVFIFSDDLEYFVNMPYDYIGAPIAKHKPWECRLYVGNGGLSLRNVQATIQVLEEKFLHQHVTLKGNEDTFFSDCGEEFSEYFRAAPLDVALEFAYDQSVARICDQLHHQKSPFGFHGWYSYDTTISRSYIEPILKNEYVWKKCTSNLECLDEVKRFFAENQRIYMYGAGDIGRVFCEFCRLAGLDFAGYIVSDEQLILNRICNQKTVVHLSEVENLEECAVAVTILRRYRGENAYESILHEKGVERILSVTPTMVFAVEEELLRSIHVT